MRCILFRGKRLDNGKWIYGNLIENCGRFFIYHTTSESTLKDNDNSIPTVAFQVDSNTVGQFSGLTDCNGKKIYEGDIVMYHGEIKQVTQFKHGLFSYEAMMDWFVGYSSNSNFTFNLTDTSEEYEIIGNIYDNPELLNK